MPLEVSLLLSFRTHPTKGRRKHDVIDPAAGLEAFTNIENIISFFVLFFLFSFI